MKLRLQTSTVAPDLTTMKDNVGVIAEDATIDEVTFGICQLDVATFHLLGLRVVNQA
jgi:hypothetical protein